MRAGYMWFLLVVCSLGMAACGGSSKKSSGGSSSASSQPTQLPRAEFVQKADAICTQGNEKRRAIKAKPPTFDPAKGSAAQLKGIADFLAVNEVITRDEFTRVAALGGPKEADAKQAWLKLKANFNVILPLLPKVARAARAGDVKAFRADFGKVTAEGPANARLGKTIGLKVCGH
jgi:hypothetical protein